MVTASDRVRADRMLQASVLDGQVRCVVCEVSETLQTLALRHRLDPVATLALGRALACAALEGSKLKGQDEFVSLVFTGDGPLRQVTAEYSVPGHLRGFCLVPRLLEHMSPNDSLPETVGSALFNGGGELTVKRGRRGQPIQYSGTTALFNGEIAEDMAHYYLDSEQLPSVINVSVKLDESGAVEAAGGVLVQKMGGADIGEEVLAEFEETASQLKLGAALQSGAKLEQIMLMLLQGQAVVDAESELRGEKGLPPMPLSQSLAGPTTVSSSVHSEFAGVQFASRDLSFACPCHRERMRAIFASMQPAERAELQRQVGKLEAVCQFCSAAYRFADKDGQVIDAP